MQLLSGEHTPLACWFWRLAKTIFLKFAIARRARQHARRMCSPEFVTLSLELSWRLGFGICCFSIYAMAHVTIETIKNGPYIVKGEVELIDVDGNKFPVEKRMALCRCGASTEKPFCDGTHSKIGFKAAERAVPESKE